MKARNKTEEIKRLWKIWFEEDSESFKDYCLLSGISDEEYNNWEAQL